MSWSASQYARFESERSRPARDLIAAVPADDVRSAVDLGCGPGNSTELVAARYPDAAIVGIDSSPDMVARASEQRPGLTFEVGDIAGWSETEPVDLIVANAAFQWVPDHAVLLPHLLRQLAPGGYLAFQIPDNLDEPAHRLMREISADPRWAAKLEGASARHQNRHSAEWYHTLLRPIASHLDLWRTTYFHELADAAAIVEWFKGSALRLYLERLGGAEQTAFLADYTAAVGEAYPTSGTGKVLLPFPRLFVVAGVTG